MALIHVPLEVPGVSSPSGAPAERLRDVVQSAATSLRQEGLHQVSVEGNTIRVARTDMARGWAWWNPLSAVQRGTLTITPQGDDAVIEQRLELDGLQRWPASWSFLLPLPLLLLTDSAREAIPYYAMGYAALALVRPVIARLLLPRALRRLVPVSRSADDPH
ncbi:MAG TPA: hypothetical protein VLE53_09465 [Gemmatimonadaceae bacterium]|nr:hypothetical protein [Gemmatimonadaceae bacterium]